MDTHGHYGDTDASVCRLSAKVPRGTAARDNPAEAGGRCGVVGSLTGSVHDWPAHDYWIEVELLNAREPRHAIVPSCIYWLRWSGASLCQTFFFRQETATPLLKFQYTVFYPFLLNYVV
jgi:hypothetical protein